MVHSAMVWHQCELAVIQYTAMLREGTRLVTIMLLWTKAVKVPLGDLLGLTEASVSSEGRLCYLDHF